MSRFRANEGNMAGGVEALEVVPGDFEPPVIDGSAVDIEDGGEHFSGGMGQKTRGRSGLPCAWQDNAEPRPRRPNHGERLDGFKPKDLVDEAVGCAARHEHAP